MITKARKLFQSISIFDIVLTAMVSVALGLSFLPWSFFYEISKPLLQSFGLHYLVNGFWLLPGILLPLIIRKPGIAIFASFVASFIQSVITQWGMMSIMWGLVQGLSAELIFFIFLYQKWNLTILILASMFSAFSSYLLDYFFYPYTHLTWQLNLAQLLSSLLSSIFFAAILSNWLTKRLLKAGVLNQYLISRKNV